MEASFKQFVEENGSTFVSAGPKNYAYKRHQGKTCCKKRDIKLSFRASEEVNFESMVDLVEKQDGSITICTIEEMVISGLSITGDSP